MAPSSLSPQDSDDFAPEAAFDFGPVALAPADVIEMIVVYAEIMRDLVNQSLHNFVLQFVRRQAELEVGAAEDIDDIRQLTGIVDAAFGQRETGVKAEEPLSMRILFLVRFVAHQYFDVIQRVADPVGQPRHGVANDGFEFVSVHVITRKNPVVAQNAVWQASFRPVAIK